MKKAIDIADLLKWRSERAEAEAPPPPPATRLLKLARPWWEMAPDLFASTVQRLSSIKLAYGYAMSHPAQGHSGHPVAAVISNGNGERESSVRILYVSVRDGRLRLRFQLAPVPHSDPSYEITFVSETALKPILLAYADLSNEEGEYRVDVELPSDVATAWTSLKVTDPMPFRFILRPASATN